MILSINPQNDFKFKFYDSVIDLDLETASIEDIKSVFTTSITSPMTFSNNRKTYINYASSNTIFLDFETKIKDGKQISMSSMAEFKATNFYKWYKCVIITSKSHRINGNGDCFHVAVQMDSNMDTLEAYKSNFKEIINDLEDEYITTDTKYTYACFSKSPEDCEILVSNGEPRAVKSKLAPYTPTDELKIEELTDIEKSFNAACRLNKDDLFHIILKWCQNIQEIQSPEGSIVRSKSRYPLGYAKLSQSQWFLLMRSIKSLFGNSKEGKTLAITLSNYYLENGGTCTPKNVIYKKYEDLVGDVCISNLFGVYKSLLCISHSFRKIYRLDEDIITISRIIGMEVCIDDYVESYQKIKRGRTLKSNKNESISVRDAVSKLSNSQNIIEEIVSATIKSRVKTIDPVEVKKKVTDKVISMVTRMVYSEEKIRKSSIKVLRDQVLSDMHIVNGLLKKHITIREIWDTLEKNGYAKKTIRGTDYIYFNPIETPTPIEEIEEDGETHINGLVLSTVTTQDFNSYYDFDLSYKDVNTYNDEEGGLCKESPDSEERLVYRIDTTEIVDMEILLRSIELANNLGYVNINEIRGLNVR